MDEKTGVVAGTRLPQHYGSDPVGFSGHPDALLERVRAVLDSEPNSDAPPS